MNSIIIKDKLKEGANASRYMGAEYQANPGSSKPKYMDAAAYYFRDDVELLEDLTPEEKEILIKEFNIGIAIEKKHQEIRR